LGGILSALKSGLLAVQTVEGYLAGDVTAPEEMSDWMREALRRYWRLRLPSYSHEPRCADKARLPSLQFSVHRVFRFDCRAGFKRFPLDRVAKPVKEIHVVAGPYARLLKDLECMPQFVGEGGHRL
jgi:hypothetical protein